MHFIKIRFNCWSSFIFVKLWVQHDQGGDDRTCLQACQRVLPRSPGPRGRRRTCRRLILRTNVKYVTNGMHDRKQTNKQYIEIKCKLGKFGMVG